MTIKHRCSTWPDVHPALPLATVTHDPQLLVAHLHQPWKRRYVFLSLCQIVSLVDSPAGLDHAGPGHLVHQVDQLHRLVLLLLLAHPFQGAWARLLFATSHRVDLDEAKVQPRLGVSEQVCQFSFTLCLFSLYSSVSLSSSSLYSASFPLNKYFDISLKSFSLSLSLLTCLPLSLYFLSLPTLCLPFACLCLFLCLCLC